MKTARSIEEYLAQLHAVAGRRKRVDASQYRRAFAEMCPGLDAVDARAKLAGWLHQLEEAGEIKLPKGDRLYDRSVSGDLPAWVELERPADDKLPLPVDPENYPWAQELRFACKIRDARLLDILLRVQRFLANGGRERPLVPAKERSIELFGYEKRLEILKSGTIFAEGQLSLDLLRCFSLPPPLIYEPVSVAPLTRPILVIENHSTYHSFARWNSHARAFCAIVYGQGDAFKTGVSGLRELLPKWSWDGQMLYFGDLDPEGLLIPLAASEILSTHDLPALRPHISCYRCLIERANSVELPTGDEMHLPSACREWLGDEVAEQLSPWFKRGTRIAQELIGWEFLASKGVTLE